MFFDSIKFVGYSSNVYDWWYFFIVLFLLLSIFPGITYCFLFLYNVFFSNCFSLWSGIYFTFGVVPWNAYTLHFLDPLCWNILGMVFLLYCILWLTQSSFSLSFSCLLYPSCFVYGFVGFDDDFVNVNATTKNCLNAFLYEIKIKVTKFFQTCTLGSE